MYRIINTDTGEIIGMVTTVNYIRRKAETGAFVTANVNNAGGIAYKSIPYNLSGREGVGVDETVVLSEFDAAEFISELKETAEMLEDALCEIDEANEERIAAIEDALCELDKEEME